MCKFPWPEAGLTKATYESGPKRLANGTHTQPSPLPLRCRAAKGRGRGWLCAQPQRLHQPQESAFDRLCCAGRAAFKRWEACEASGEAYTYRPPNAEELKEAQADAAAAKSAKAAAKALVNAAGERLPNRHCTALKRLRPFRLMRSADLLVPDLPASLSL